MKIRMVENADTEKLIKPEATRGAALQKLIKVNQFYQSIISAKQKPESPENRMFKE